MNRFVTSACALCFIHQVAVAQPAIAQSAALTSQPSVAQVVATTQTPVPAASGEMASASTSAGPTTESARAGIAPSVSRDAAGKTAHVMTDPHVGAGQNIALMVVGGAALITGLLIGGGAGAAVAIGGAAIGLVGLYGYVK